MSRALTPLAAGRVVGVGRRAVLAAAAAVAGLVAVAWALDRGGTPFARLGVTAPPAGIVAAVPLVRFVATVASGATLGLLVVALVGCPTTSGARDLSAHAFRAVRRAGAAAAAWAAAASLASVLLVVAGTGGSARVLGEPAILLQTMADLEEPAGMLVAAVAAVTAAVIARLTFSWRSAAGALAVAAAGILAATVTGQVASAGAGHDIATDAAVLAALAGGVWLGCALAGALDGRESDGGDGDDPVRRAAARLVPVGRVAAVVTVVGTALATAPLVRGEWLSSVYGLWSGARLLLLAAALVVTVLRPSRPVVVGALLLLSAGASAVIATEPAPAYDVPVSIQQVLLGFELSPPSTLSLLGPGRLNLLFTVIAVVLAAGYLAAYRRLVARGDPWPVGRLVAWLAGCGLLLWTVDSGLGSQAMAMFSAHMGTHMLISMTVTVLLALGGPVTLALRALPAGDGGPRTWLASLMDSPLARLLTHPLVSLAIFVGSLYGLYFSSIFDTALPFHWAHQLMWLHFLVTGYLFFWPIIGVDRSPRPLPHVARLALLLASMPFHAFFGVALLGADEVIGNEVYRQLSLPWVPDLLADQSLAGGIAWTAGEGPLLIVVIALLVQWSRADHREAGRADRRADRDGDAELAEWNAMLADLAKRR